MTKKQKNRLSFLAIIFTMISGITLIAVSAYKNEISFFVTPSKIRSHPKNNIKTLRLGGKVKPCSVTNDGTYHLFTVFDEGAEIYVKTKAPLPPLFKDNQGVVVEGYFSNTDNIFYGSKVLAKHDEKYMPKACLEK
ncbi:MAG: cytochrome c biogenesis protein CcmE [Alphaproteobacteria bacterium CG_4_10_14_0_8_um_filter_37_21]|nr:MAG: cytochrome c biogenesis protein CcmE [Alphaproteobacteria bacterium CG_4_10_14_0_8_um_filter_37_21]